MEDKLMCECGWIGHRMELVSIDGDDDSFIYCPDCHSSTLADAEDE